MLIFRFKVQGFTVQGWKTMNIDKYEDNATHQDFIGKHLT